MSKVVIDLSMSLDGFIAEPNDDVDRIFGWYTTGTEPMRGNAMFTPEGVNRQVVEAMYDTTGAMIFGRRTYDITHGWGGSHPIPGLPLIILTHTPPKDPPKGKSPFTFVTDGIDSAVKKAKAAAGSKDVGIAGASAAQQALKAGLVDEILVHVAPYILGDGVRLFDHLGDAAIKLEKLEVIDGKLATHLRYRVVRRSK